MKSLAIKAMNKYSAASMSVKAGIWFLVCSIIQKSFTLVVTPIFTRLLTTEQFGEYSLYISWLQILTIFCTFRLDYGVFNKGMSKYGDNKDQYTASMQSVATVFTIIMLVIYLIFMEEINIITELNTVIMLFIFLELMFTPAMSFWLIRQRYDFKYKGVIFATIALSLVNLVVSLVAVLSMEDKGVARILSCVLVQTCFGCFFYFINLRKGKKLWRWDYIKFAILFNIPLLPHYFSTYILEQSDRIIIQKLCGIEATAFYSVAYNAGAIVKIVVNSVNNALIPWQYRKLEKREFEELNRPIESIAILFALCLIIFIALAPELMQVFAGNKYMEAVFVIPPVAASMYFVLLYSIFCNMEFYFNANKFTMFLSIAVAAINVILNIVFIPLFGYITAAYTTLICYILFAFIHYQYINYISRKNINRNIVKSKNLIYISIMLISCMITFNLIYEYILVRYVIILALFGLLFWKKRVIIDVVRGIKN